MERKAMTKSIPKECPDCKKPYIAYETGKKTLDECPHCKVVAENKIVIHKVSG